jgi:hypothetical protein
MIIIKIINYLYNLFFGPTESKDASLLKLIYEGEEVGQFKATDCKTAGDCIIPHDIKVDFILYEYPIENHAKYDKVVYRYGSLKNFLFLEYIELNALNYLEFTDINLAINGTDCPIPIDFGRTQYMLAGNVLFDREFIQWYLRDKHDIKLQDEDSYTVSFIDHEQQPIIIPDYCYLLLKKNSYDIVNVINN